MNYKYHINTPVGIICIEANEEAVTGLYIEKNEIIPKQEKPETALLKKAGIQLEEYFSRKRKVFDLPLAPSGTAFQKKSGRRFVRFPMVKPEATVKLQLKLEIRKLIGQLAGQTIKIRL